MANTENIKVVEQEAEETVKENTEMVVAEKKGFIQTLKGLKTWQKVVIGTTGAVALVLGGKMIYDLIKDNHEVVTDAIETAAEEATENIAA